MDYKKKLINNAFDVKETLEGNNKRVIEELISYVNEMYSEMQSVNRQLSALNRLYNRNDRLHNENVFMKETLKEIEEVLARRRQQDNSSRKD